MIKALALKEPAVTLKSLSAQKAASRKRIASGKENQPPVTAPPAFATSPPTFTSAPTTARHVRTGTQPVVPAPDKGMSACYHHSLLTAQMGNAAPTATVAEVVQDPNPVGTDTVTAEMAPEEAAELAIVCGEYSTCFLYASLILFYSFFSSAYCHKD